MATYVVLGNWTDEGARTAGETVARAASVRSAAQTLGGDVPHVFWTMGRYDFVAICEAPDDETATAISLALGSSGVFRSETLRAFEADEMAAILARLG